MSESADLRINDQSFTLPIIMGKEQEKAIDISQLRKQSKFITFDDGYGNTAWPWDDVWNFNEHMRKSNYIKIIDKVIQNSDSINKFVDIKTDFASKEIVINNFFAFLLSEQYEDENFKLKVARHT